MCSAHAGLVPLEGTNKVFPFPRGFLLSLNQAVLAFPPKASNKDVHLKMSEIVTKRLFPWEFQTYFLDFTSLGEALPTFPWSVT